jgi:predicted CXXCH cytochrome family protein
MQALSLIAFLLVLPATPSAAANHPPVTGKNANCTSCHADLTQGKSVHSEGELACVLCHKATSQGNALTMGLTLPREQICFACHERTAMQRHWPAAKGGCMDCHDAHRSARDMLLHRDVEIGGAYSQATSETRNPPRNSRVRTKRAQP